VDRSASDRSVEDRRYVGVAAPEDRGRSGRQPGPYGEQLPFLLKVLAVDAPLSLQVHPDAEQAKAGFAREAASGTPIRSYQDDQPKPELICAVNPVPGALRFRDPHGSAELLDTLKVERLRPVLDRLEAGDLREASGPCWTGHRRPPRLIDEIAAACRDRIGVPEYEQAALLPSATRATWAWCSPCCSIW